MDVSLDEDDHEDAWPAYYQDLLKLEKELRCPICGEFINTCLSLPDCLHSCTPTAIPWRQGNVRRLLNVRVSHG
jgi:hypothetical protein